MLEAGQIEVRNADRLFIGGEWVKPSSDLQSRVISPSMEREIVRVAAADRADMDRAVAAARFAFDHGPWPRMAAADRADLIQALYDGIQRRWEAFAHAWTAQVGTPIALSRYATQGGGGIHLAYYADLIRRHPLVERHDRATGGQALVVRESVGVTAAIIPWNAPLLLTTSKLGPALAMGGAVVVKAAPETPVEAHMLAEIVEEIGFPPGVINIVSADRAASEYLVRHPGVDKVAFTGSSAVGKHIAGICAERVARYTLELGGKSAAIVLEDMDPADVVPGLVAGSTFLAGQACSGLTRILVPAHRQKDYVEALAEAYRAIAVGDPFDGGTQLGPLAIARQRDRVEDFIRSGVAEGARIATGGGRPSGLDSGYYVEPTVFYGADNAMRIAREEIFGPVATVIAHDGEADAIAIANDSPFGLGGAVFTNDADAAYRVARGMRTGNVSHNGWEFDPAYPFGGFKQSGVGREGGFEGLHVYSEVKTIYMSAAPGSVRADGHVVDIGSL
ncbi:aldehyde dehydrogenase [Sphingomonas sp. Root50]|uniref:aldehyde dehydrogenase n=1 Tax=Sphingomonas sp. Root50 TaxID=1736551 RepID=UPI000AFB7B0D|nr:aldehyde dehydrogenase [Sphingomonas sp. Root50]